ncbi:MAG: hypothetical protein QM831_27645 [Kofleriaceae bacterium]
MKTLASLLLLTATAYADGEINVSVTGAIDPGVVGTSIATELSRPVTQLAKGDVCRAPCLMIAIAGSSATVTFTSEKGGTRQRTIELGTDHAQWPELVTLLAGNLVRDDADELLPAAAEPTVVEAPVVQQDAPPALVVAPPAVVLSQRAPVIVHDEPHAIFGLSLVPGISTDLLDVQRSHYISIGLVAGSSGDVSGAAFSGAVDVARSVSGAQVSGAVAVAGELTGVQIAGAVTVADRSRGSQIAGAVAFANTSASQIAGAIAYSGNAGMQIAGAVSVATLSRTQISGAVNVTGTSKGLQLAPINIAHRNDGVQIGVINIGGGPDADAFGLINIVPGGRTDLEVSGDSSGLGTILFRHGGRHWHNVYGFGGQKHDATDTGANNDVWMYGLGFGPSFHLGSLPADLEAIAWNVNHGNSHEKEVSILAQLRLTVGIPVGPVTLVAGGAINTYVSSDHTSPLFTARSVTDYPMDSNVVTRLWPSVFAGVRI